VALFGTIARLSDDEIPPSRSLEVPYTPAAHGRASDHTVRVSAVKFKEGPTVTDASEQIPPQKLIGDFVAIRVAKQVFGG